MVYGFGAQLHLCRGSRKVEALDFLSVVLGALTALTIALPSAFAFRRQWIQTRTSELTALVETRGLAIDDLVSKATTLELRVAKLESMYNALQSVKAEEIAVHVVHLLCFQKFGSLEGFSVNCCSLI